MSFVPPNSICSVFRFKCQTNPSQLYDTFSSASSNFVAKIGLSSSTSSYCSLPSAARPALYFASSSSSRILTTIDLAIPSGSPILQFKLVIGCGSPRATPGTPVNLKYSTNYGQSYSYLISKCYLGQSCTSTGGYRYESAYYNQAYPKWTRVTVSLNTLAGQSKVRFQWSQAYSSTADYWAIDDVYIGAGCSSACTGHGDCTPTGCKCDSSFSGSACQTSSGLPTQIRDTFNVTTIDSTKWSLMVGGYVSTGCDVLSSGTSLYFSQGGQRMLVSRDVNTAQAR